MDAARLPRYPHLAWMLFFLWVPSGGRQLSVPMRGTTCAISIALNGRRAASQVTYGQRVDWTETSGTVSCIPVDDEQHTYLMTSDSGCELFCILIPPNHLMTVEETEGVKASGDWTPILGSQDAVMRDCMVRLAANLTADHKTGDMGVDEVARRLILRLLELIGGGKPDWHDDGSVFDRRTLLNLVAYVDEHLRIAPSLSDMSMLAGMSPSHFAKKFRHSTGLSLQRFVNRRRILRSLESLRTDDSLASIALDLGFSSQSHFTRIFSDLTGMTPAKYRQSVKPTLG
jgi:AraC-like DNA-binding protein